MPIESRRPRARRAHTPGRRVRRWASAALGGAVLLWAPLAAAEPLVFLTWTGTTGAGSPGSDYILAKPGDVLTATLFVVVGPEGMGSYSISVEFDEDGADELDLLQVVPIDNTEFPIPLPPGAAFDSEPGAAGQIQSIAAFSFPGLGGFQGPGEFAAATIEFLATANVASDGFDVRPGFIVLGVDGVTAYGGADISFSTEFVEATVDRDTVCGDGTQEPGEECDDGNTMDGDGCQATCLLPACGDGVLDVGEECDDGGTADGDGCDALCVVEFCGDGVVNGSGLEECDDGNGVNEDACRNDCTLPSCGDGVLDEGEDCDDGNGDAGDGCRADCSEEVCGDGVTDPGEECDDGNTVNGDGCNVTCTTVLVASIDIRPGTTANPVNPKAKGDVPVAILAASGFGPADVDEATLAFGPGGAAASTTQVKDTDGDGLDDLVARFPIPESGLAVGDLEACVAGELLDGTPFEGCDAVSTVVPPPRCGLGFELGLLAAPLLGLRARRRRWVSRNFTK